MVERNIKHRRPSIPQMECVYRIQSIPLVENSIKRAESVYNRIKNSNSFFNWYFSTAESVSAAAIDTIAPVVQFVEGPIQKLDQVVCKSLDLVEQRVPSVYLPPEMMYWNTKEYMSERLVRPVIKRAHRVRKMSNAVIMENRVSTYAAVSADRCLSAADAVIEKYLPGEQGQDERDGLGADSDNSEGAVAHAFHHGRRVSKKLRRRLTHRTVAEVKALKKQSKEAVHILFYAAELIITDPRQFIRKVKELWDFLSDDEPENQARPQTIEQLAVMLTRESARRIVHLTNFTFATIAKIPRNMKETTTEFVNHFLIATNSLMKATHLDTLMDKTRNEVYAVIIRVQSTYEAYTSYTNIILERLAIFLSGRLETEKISPNPRRRAIRRQQNTSSNNNPPARDNQQQATVNGDY